MVEKKMATECYDYKKRSEAGKDASLIGLIYGDFGTGKTYLAGTIERTIQQMNKETPVDLDVPEDVTVRYATLFANAEQGEDGLPLDCGDIIIKDIVTYKDFSRMYDFLKLHHRAFKAGDTKKLMELHAAYFKTPINEITELWIFMGVVVDSLTEIQKFCLYQLIGLSQDSKLDDEPEYMQMRDWGTALEMILLMVRNFRALPGYKLFISQQMEDQDEKKKMFFRPALQGQAKLSILGFFDFAGYYTMKAKEDGVTRCLALTPIGAFKAKHRFEKFKGNYVMDPTLPMLLDIRDGKTNEKPKTPAGAVKKRY